MGPFHQPPPVRPSQVPIPSRSGMPPSIAPPPPPRSSMTPSRRPPQLEGKAAASAVLGVLSMIPFAGALFGIPAIVFGALARRDIDRARGAFVNDPAKGSVRLEGRSLAASGIVTGLFGTGLAFVLILWVMGAAFAPPEVTEPSGYASAEPSPTDEPPSSSVAASDSPAPAAPPSVRSYGSLEVVDLDATRPLRVQLGEIVKRSSRGRTIVLQTYEKTNTACEAVDASLPDLRMQHALANVTLVRVDINEYTKELDSMKVETKTAPWFYKLDAKGVPTDSISADAWDANIPENMAPALGKFVQKSSRRRK